jgi:16S rRNA (uracil1498-N3)-methyltransferase
LRHSLRTIRIYQPGIYVTDQLLALSQEASQHVGKVLRMLPGESLILFCGDNKECLACIESVNKKGVVVRLGSIEDVNRESPLSLHLGQALSKGERMEWVVQKAVELGVASITPVFSARCAVKKDAERLSKKRQQWQSIAIAACEQSGRNIVPVIHPPIDLTEYVQNVRSEFKLVLHPGGCKTWRDNTLNQNEGTILIGPEGGLNDEEVALATGFGFQRLSLGPRVLRTETAAITILSILQAMAGDL